MTTKILPSDIPYFYRSPKVQSDDFTIFFKKSPSFSYQIIIPDKASVNKPKKNKLKRQVSNLITDLGYGQINAQILIVKKNKTQLEFQQIKDQLLLLKNILLKKSKECYN